ncbi:MAG: pentapeptide repeat-containing protein [Methanothrix sp.]|nr:pentapeptide repeat-containing protein [Methanothrix sp.]
MASRFHEETIFDYSIFKNSCYFGENTTRNGAVFYKSSSFQFTEFNGYARFVYAKFYLYDKEYTYFPGIHFRCAPCKENSKLHSSFINSRFNDRIDFYKAIFEIDAYFERVIFAKDSNFSSIRFDGIASFFRTKFGGDVASFENSIFNDDADFCGTFFSKYANFKSSKFAKEANFRATYFDGDALFNEANFNENFNLSESKLSFLKLSRATFAERSLISLMDSIFSQIDIPWGSIENRLYHDKYLDYNNSYNDGVYLSLIQSYERSGNFDDADACRVQYKKDMYQLSIKKRQLSAKWFPFVSYFVDKFFFGYGARLKYPFVIMIMLLCLYIFLYVNASCTVSSLNLTKEIIANLLGWFLVPIFVVVLAKKFLR